MAAAAFEAVSPSAKQIFQVCERTLNLDLAMTEVLCFCFFVATRVVGFCFFFATWVVGFRFCFFFAAGVVGFCFFFATGVVGFCFFFACFAMSTIAANGWAQDNWTSNRNSKA